MLEADVNLDYELVSMLRPLATAGGWRFPMWCRCAIRVSRNVGFAWFFFLSTVFLRAQGTLDYVVLQTGGGQPLVSNQQLLQTAGVPAPALSFDFGFSTEEIVAPAAFLDSFTVTLQDASTATALLLTADASGVLWSPSSPGAVFISDSDIERAALIPPSLQPIFGRGVGFSVRVPLPAQFAGPTVTMYFDLFDNLDGLMSLGWYYNPRIVSVPEPHPAWLLTFGLLLAAFRRRRNT